VSNQPSESDVGYDMNEDVKPVSN